jgi:hypothetical protein
LPNCWSLFFLVLPKLDGCQVCIPNCWSCSDGRISLVRFVLDYHFQRPSVLSYQCIDFRILLVCNRKLSHEHIYIIKIKVFHVLHWLSPSSPYYLFASISSYDFGFTLFLLINVIRLVLIHLKLC